jgi:hypothetical protein
MMIRLNVRTIENVAKLIDSLTDKNHAYTFHVWCDEYQSLQKPQDRWFTVEIADLNDGQRFLYDYENENYYTLDEAKEILGIE